MTCGFGEGLDGNERVGECREYFLMLFWSEGGFV